MLGWIEIDVRVDIVLREYVRVGAERVYISEERRAKGRKSPLFLRHCVKSPLCYVGFVSITEEGQICPPPLSNVKE